MPNRILTEEPDPGGQICGEQIEYGNGRASRYCGEVKAPGLHRCRECHAAVLGEYGQVRVAPGSAIGR